MADLLRESINQISDPGNLDASVEESFAVMLGCNCSRISQAPLEHGDSLIAVVGFGGVLSGACIFRCSMQAAITIAGCMAGAEFTAVDATVLDAIGEICNIVAGTWKGRVPEIANHCDLSVPAVIAGRDYRIGVHPPVFTLRHVYRFNSTDFEVTIVCERLH